MFSIITITFYVPLFYFTANSQNIYIQSVTGGTDQTSGECSLGQTIPI